MTDTLLQPEPDWRLFLSNAIDRFQPHLASPDSFLYRRPPE